MDQDRGDGSADGRALLMRALKRLVESIDPTI